MISKGWETVSQTREMSAQGWETSALPWETLPNLKKCRLNFKK
jgi:hypothetical protein